MTPERLMVSDYLSVTLKTNGAFVFRRPSLSYVANIYYLPFAGIVWICAIISVILCTFLVHLTYRYSMKEESRDLNFTDYVLYAINTVCQTGGYLSPKKSSGRIATV